MLWKKLLKSYRPKFKSMNKKILYYKDKRIKNKALTKRNIKIYKINLLN